MVVELIIVIAVVSEAVVIIISVVTGVVVVVVTAVIVVVVAVILFLKKFIQRILWHHCFTCFMVFSGYLFRVNVSENQKYDIFIRYSPLYT